MAIAIARDPPRRQDCSRRKRRRWRSRRPRSSPRVKRITTSSAETCHGVNMVNAGTSSRIRASGPSRVTISPVVSLACCGARQEHHARLGRPSEAGRDRRNLGVCADRWQGREMRAWLPGVLAVVCMAGASRCAQARRRDEPIAGLSRPEKRLAALRQSAGTRLRVSTCWSRKPSQSACGRVLELQWFESELDEESNPVLEANALLSDRRCHLIAGYPLFATALGEPSASGRGCPISRAPSGKTGAAGCRSTR